MRDLLIVIDMQNDFIDGALGTPEAELIVPSVVEEIGKYKTSDIFLTRDTHQSEYLTTREGKHLPVEHCIQGTHGWELREEVAKAAEGGIIIDKPTFGSTILLEEVLRIAREEEITITLIGLCTDICVVSNALLLKASLYETPIRVIEHCCAGVTPETHNAAIATMKMCQIDIL